MDASVFAEYETDLEAVARSVADKLEGDALTLRGGSSLAGSRLPAATRSRLPSHERRSVFRRVERELEEADEIIAQMEVEVQTAHRDKVELRAKLREHKSKIMRQKNDLKSLASTADRDDLLAAPSTSSSHVAIEMDDRAESPSSLSLSQAQAQRSQLLSATDKLSDGQRRLEDSHRVALEAEDLGTGILRDLRGQRDVLERTRDHARSPTISHSLYEADGSIDRASNTLRKMVRRMYQQRAITYAIIAVLIFLILYVLFSKMF
ncbi:SPOSA6832_03112, partial [Sporobolomyces salmonicolor]